jgi:LuxR family transcriptional regulator, maltose regulon positive regulatory protein
MEKESPMELVNHDPFLITTKLAIPPHYLKKIVQRTQIYAQMDAGLQRPLMIIKAAAGFGKTTLVSEWIRQSNTPAAWVSLEQTDNDALLFWSYILTALHQLQPALAELLATWETSAHNLQIETMLTQLINISMDLTQDIVLVLDDYHTITSPSIHQGLAFLLEHLPPQLHLIIITRYDPPLPLARVRVQGRLTELRTDELRFTEDEALFFLTQTMNIDLSPDDACELRRRTEGWIAGLQLAALSLRNQEDKLRISHFIKTFTAIDRNIHNYLTDEVLLHQPEETQEFLLKTSILQRLNASLCDAITGQTNGATMLEWLDQHNLFLNALDNQQNWYRYDQLFLEVLRNHLKHKYPGQSIELQRNASLWYEQHDMRADAITHAIAAADMEHAARLIEQNVWNFIQDEEEIQINTWLISLPDSIFSTRPILSYLHAYTSFFHARMENFELTLAWAEQSWQQAQNTLLLNTATELRARAALYSGQSLQAITYAKQILSAITEEKAPLLYSHALIHLGAAYLSRGELAEADRYLAEGSRLGQKYGYARVTLDALLYLSDLQKTRGNLHAALQTLQPIFAETKKHAIWYHIAAQIRSADIYHEWNNLSAASEQIKQAQKLAEQTHHEGFITSKRYLILAQLAWSQDEIEQAFMYLDQAEQSSQRFGPHYIFLGQIAALRTHFLLAQNKHSASHQWQAHYMPIFTDDMSASEKESYIKAQAQLLMHQSQSKEAIHLLKAAEHSANEQGRSESEIALLVLLTLAYHIAGNTQATMQTLERALLLAEPGGYMRVFVAEGSIMATLLTELYSRYQRHSIGETSNVPLSYIYTLLTYFGTDAQPSLWLVSHDSEELLVDRLSEREYMVLGLIAEGLSNQEIAQKLVVTVSTIKTHLNNLYAKLHVHTRLQAVTKAYDMGVLRRNEVDTGSLTPLQSTKKM